MSKKKIKILTVSDIPLGMSGVGIQTRNFIQSLLATGDFKIVSLGGSIKHKNYQPIKTEEYGDDFVVFPVDGFGNEGILRSILRNEKPDIMWIMTDPRFFEWIWSMEDEIRSLVPLVYYHVWDNFPYPRFNKQWYSSNDKIVTISKVTDEIVRNVAPDVECEYLPHAVNLEVFKSLEPDLISKIKEDNFGESKDKFIFFWNNRNAKRKLAATVIYWFGKFLEKVGKDKAMLLMHTAPNDPNGPNLEAVIANFGLDSGEVMFSTNKMSEDDLAAMYNMVDCTINISDAEGFGLSTLESLSCGTPIVVNMTGGLQEQVTNGTDWYGVGLKPTSRAIVGSQNVPYIFEDRVTEEQFVSALEKIYNLPKEELNEMGRMGQEHIFKNYSWDTFSARWPEMMKEVHEKYGSWETRKNYSRWTLKEI
jgi:glycosyltransferase involved in cell wall biosynthesis